MANTFTQIHIQAIFAVQSRRNLIHESWKNELYKYITAILQSYDHKMLQINGVSDHVHILFGLRPSQYLSDLMKYVKQGSSKWINKRGFLRSKFSWQDGYGAFSYSKPELPRIIRYIENQEEHHKKKSLREEYISMMETHGIEYDERFIFKSVFPEE